MLASAAVRARSARTVQRRGGTSDASTVMQATWKRYRLFLRQPAELNLAWRDAETGARGWLVINSLRGGAAGGGTRMRAAIDAREVTHLAKTMELKFALSGPPIGGAKSGIDFDPADPRKPGVLDRWYRAIAPYLQTCYGTGGDLNVDEVDEVIPCVERLGLRHPQEGIVHGHLRADGAGFGHIISRLDAGVKAAASAEFGVDGLPLTVADLVTGYGVASAVRRFYAHAGRDLEGVRVLLEGFGNVGASCALHLARAGARILAISDAQNVLVAPDGLDASEIESLIRRRERKLLPAADPRVVRGSARTRFWSGPADVFVCAALSGTLDERTLGRLAHAGVRVVACGANQPFREVKAGSTRVQQRADRHFSILPDVLANCGMARTFSYLMEEHAQPHDRGIVAAVDRTICDTLDEVLSRADKRGTSLLAATLAVAMDRIGAP